MAFLYMVLEFRVNYITIRLHTVLGDWPLFFCAHQVAISHSLKFFSLYEDGCLDRLFFEVQELLAFFIFHEIFKILLAIKCYKVDFVRMLHVCFDNHFFIGPDSKQKPAIVFADDRDGHIFKLVEDIFLAFAYIDELGDVEHIAKAIICGRIAVYLFDCLVEEIHQWNH